jgi:NTP pyrophosphatase (non-canonical NTP hydrolase)
MKELDLHQSQNIAGQLDGLFKEIGLPQTPEFHLQVMIGEVQEAIEAHDSYSQTPNEQTRNHLAGELADVLYCVLSIMNDYGIDANEGMNYVFTKIYGRINREHIGNVREDTGFDGCDLYREAKGRFDPH